MGGSQQKTQKKGYKDLVKSKPLVSDFHRPHRKELMSSIFRKASERAKDRIVDIEQLEKHHTNPLAAAIDQQLDNGPLPYVLRPLIKLPPNYKAKLCELQSIGYRFGSALLNEGSYQKEMRKAKLRLSFEDNVVDAYVKDAQEERKEVDADEGKETDILVGPRSEDSSHSHRNVGSESLTNAVEIKRDDVMKSEENWQSRNVSYMLHIWEKSEGAAVAKIQASTKGKEKKKKLKESTLLSMPSISAIGRNASPQLEKQLDTASNNDINESTTISSSTLELLKRMSRDSPSDPIHDPPTEHAIVHKILTGVEPNARRKEFLESILLEEELIGDAKRTFETPFKTMTPGTCYKAIGNLISDDGDLMFEEYCESTQAIGKQWTPFELFIPPLVDEEFQSRQTSLTPDRKDAAIALIRNPTKNVIGERLRAIFGRKIVIPPPSTTSINTTFKPAYLKDRVAPITEKPHSLTIKRFSLLLKSLLQTDSHDVFEEEEKRSISAYLDCESCRKAYLPGKFDNDRDVLISCLINCLRKDQIKYLCLESAKLLILMEADANLGRWDTMIFKQGLKDIMEIGTDDQKQVVAIYNIKNSQITNQDIQQIRLGLGDLDSKKRDTAIHILGSMPEEFANQVVAILIQDGMHSNWRIRLDVIAILKKCIPRLAPSDTGPPPPRDKDALDTDSDATIKALFHTLGESGGGNIEGIDLLPPTVDSIDELQPLESSLLDISGPPLPLKKQNDVQLITQEKHTESTTNIEQQPSEQVESLYYQCVDSLLKLMTSDWNVDVRIAASDAVGQLQLGNAFFEWIVRSLDSSDPVIRIDGLRCLSCFGAIHENSLQSLLKSFKDPYASVRVEACKVALSLSCSHRPILASLMDLLDDHDYKVRAYAIKAIGSSKSKTAKVRECLNWAILYDSHPIVRTEALQAAHQLGLIHDDANLRSSALTLLSSDPSERIQKEAERILIQAGVLFPNMSSNTGDVGMAEQERGSLKHEQRVTVDGQIVSPYPHLLLNRSQEEVEIYLRESLIGNDEVKSVIDQVEKLSSKAAVMAQVNEMGGMESIGLRLDIANVAT